LFSYLFFLKKQLRFKKPYLPQFTKFKIILFPLAIFIVPHKSFNTYSDGDYLEIINFGKIHKIAR